MSLTTSIALGMAMGVLAIVNAGLMVWLWRFPPVPDPTGQHPGGVPSSPPFWRGVHRAVGYGFVVLYVALLVEMVPRGGEYREVSALGVAHAVLGVLVGAILAFKIAIVRRVRGVAHLRRRLPWIGGTLAATTLAVVALGVIPAWTLARPLTSLPPDLDRGRTLVAERCVQCHGSSTLLSDDDEWDDTVEDMQDKAERTPGKTPITDAERTLIVAYLSHIRPDRDEHRAVRGERNDRNDERADRDDEDDDRGGRRRRRGRDH